MPGRAPIFPDRIRKICGSFSWIEHRFLHDGFLRTLAPEELLLYYFLVTVGDRNGVSYYDYEKICQLLKLPLEAYIRARDALVQRGLVAYHQGVFQVLPLPARNSPPPQPLQTTAQAPKQREGNFHALAEIFKHLEQG